MKMHMLSGRSRFAAADAAPAARRACAEATPLILLRCDNDSYISED
jgi:hypothetical protein